MEVIRTWDELPYPINLVKQVATIRFKEDCSNDIKLREAIVMCDIIRGISEANDHYSLMEDSVDIFDAITHYDIKTIHKTVAEFKKFKHNRSERHRMGFIDTPLGNMETWYCEESIYNILQKRV